MHSEWSRRKFEACVSLCRNGLSYKNGEESGGLPISRIQTISEGKIDLSKVGFAGLGYKDSGTHLLEAGDILFSHINSAAQVGKVALLEEEHLPLIHGMNLLRLKPSEILSSRFLFFVLQSSEFRSAVVARSQVAVNQVSINIGSLKEIELLVPPLHIQRRIVDLVSSVDAYIDTLQQLGLTARTARNAVLHELLSASGDEWIETTLGTVFELSNRKLGRHQNEPEIFAVSKYNGVVLAEEYFDKRIASKSLDGYKVIGPGDWVYSTIHIDEGSIAVNHFPFDGVVSPMYTSMKWRSGQHDASFFEYLLKSDAALIRYQENAQGTVNRRRSLSWKTFSDLVFFVPPFEEQKRIVEIVRSMDDVIQSTEQAVTDAKNLRSGLLSDLLSGEHEIPASYDVYVGAA
jgi:restriction endonuclease S subunit